MCILTRTSETNQTGERLDPVDPLLRPIRSSELFRPALAVHGIQSRSLHFAFRTRFFLAGAETITAGALVLSVLVSTFPSCLTSLSSSKM